MTRHCTAEVKVEWVVKYTSPSKGRVTSIYDSEKFAREYYEEKKEAKRRGVSLIKRTTTVEEIEEK